MAALTLVARSQTLGVDLSFKSRPRSSVPQRFLLRSGFSVQIFTQNTYKKDKMKYILLYVSEECKFQQLVIAKIHAKGDCVFH